TAAKSTKYYFLLPKTGFSDAILAAPASLRRGRRRGRQPDRGGAATERLAAIGFERDRRTGNGRRREPVHPSPRARRRAHTGRRAHRQRGAAAVEARLRFRTERARAERRAQG